MARVVIVLIFCLVLSVFALADEKETTEFACPKVQFNVPVTANDSSWDVISPGIKESDSVPSKPLKYEKGSFFCIAMSGGKKTILKRENRPGMFTSRPYKGDENLKRVVERVQISYEGCKPNKIGFICTAKETLVGRESIESEKMNLNQEQTGAKAAD